MGRSTGTWEKVTESGESGMVISIRTRFLGFLFTRNPPNTSKPNGTPSRPNLIYFGDHLGRGRRMFSQPVDTALETSTLIERLKLALQHTENKTTVLAFTQKLNPTLEKWRTKPWSKRVYVISEDGLYISADGPHAPPAAGEKRDWWTFAGVTKMLNSGAESCAL